MKNEVNTTTENNKLLAEFLDTRERKSYNYFYYIPYFERVFSDNELKFNSDWNWLIQVVEKIESLGYWVEILGGVHNVCQVGYTNNIDNFIYTDSETKIEAVYKACVEFVKWYNENGAEEKRNR